MDHVRESSQKKYIGSINFIRRELKSILMEHTFFFIQETFLQEREPYILREKLRNPLETFDT